MSDWKKCNTCKKSIGFKSQYYICNVTTCTRKRTGLVFCSVSCWDAHVPMVRHRESWAEERKSPSESDWAEVLAGKVEDPTFFKEKTEETTAPTEEDSGPRKSFAESLAPKVILRRTPKETK